MEARTSTKARGSIRPILITVLSKDIVLPDAMCQLFPLGLSVQSPRQPQITAIQCNQECLLAPSLALS